MFNPEVEPCSARARPGTLAPPLRSAVIFLAADRPPPVRQDWETRSKTQTTTTNATDPRPSNIRRRASEATSRGSRLRTSPSSGYWTGNRRDSPRTLDFDGSISDEAYAHTVKIVIKSSRRKRSGPLPPLWGRDRVGGRIRRAPCLTNVLRPPSPPSPTRGEGANYMCRRIRLCLFQRY